MRLLNIVPENLKEFNYIELPEEVFQDDGDWLFSLMEFVENNKSSFCADRIWQLRKIERAYIFGVMYEETIPETDYYMDIEFCEASKDLAFIQKDEEAWIEDAKRWRYYSMLLSRIVEIDENM